MLFVTHDVFLAVHDFWVIYSCVFAFNRPLMTFELLMIFFWLLMSVFLHMSSCSCMSTPIRATPHECFFCT